MSSGMYGGGVVLNAGPVGNPTGSGGAPNLQKPTGEETGSFGDLLLGAAGQTHSCLGRAVSKETDPKTTTQVQRATDAAAAQGNAKAPAALPADIAADKLQPADDAQGAPEQQQKTHPSLHAFAATQVSLCEIVGSGKAGQKHTSSEREKARHGSDAANTGDSQIAPAVTQLATVSMPRFETTPTVVTPPVTTGSGGLGSALPATTMGSHPAHVAQGGPATRLAGGVQTKLNAADGLNGSGGAVTIDAQAASDGADVNAAPKVDGSATQEVEAIDETTQPDFQAFVQGLSEAAQPRKPIAAEMAAGQSTGKAQVQGVPDGPAARATKATTQTQAARGKLASGGADHAATPSPVSDSQSATATGGGTASASAGFSGATSLEHAPSQARQAAMSAGTGASALVGARETKTVEAHAATSGARVEIGIQDPSLGEVRVQASLDRTGLMHIDVAGRSPGTDAMLDQIAPLLHAAVVQQIDGHGQARAVQLTAAATFSEHGGGGSGAITGSGAAALGQGSSLASSLASSPQQEQQSQQQRRPYTEQLSSFFASDGPDPKPAAAAMLSSLHLAQPGGSSGLSVRI